MASTPSASQLFTLAALLLLSSICLSEATRSKKEFSVRVVVQTNSTSFLSGYPKEVGSVRVLGGNVYDYDTNEFLGYGFGKCTIVRAPDDTGRYRENCAESFDFGPEKGQIVLLGALRNTVDPLDAPANFLAASGGTLEFLDASGQAKRRVVPPSEDAFRLPGEIFEVKYTFMIRVSKD